ncbi:pyridine nucleotide-disulfide oxidoreductase [Cumulibacter soli]|uniref:pyridine nucleotide-disulfide oxidoreductase n=1 Tax=Cumulibacter soli TaxID=2546344 RepID=UPI001067FFD2|nr:pyridine nucleotide-disulfide oxidoreductase [Cumulibacter soli]
MGETLRAATVVVIGAGQAGLSAAYHLQRRGFIGVPPAAYARIDAALGTPSQDTSAPGTFVVLDANSAPGGAWQHRWKSLTMATVNGIFDLPGQAQQPADPTEAARTAVPRYFTGYEHDFALPIHRPVSVTSVPALQLLEEISRDATTFWYTRREPVFIEGEFMPETTGRAIIAKVTADAEAGLPGRSVVSYTGITPTSYVQAAMERGVLNRRPMFTAIEPAGVREAAGNLTPVDTILWATGFRPAIAHLEPLGLRGTLGGIPVSGTQAEKEPRLHLIGFGPSQSTVGANRAGRAAVSEITKALDARLAAVVAARATVVY